MIEIFVLLMILFLIKSCLYSSSACMRFFSQSETSMDSSIHNHGPESKTHDDTGTFMTYLKNEIEAELFPRPTDSILRRHYETLVERKVEARLVLMPD